MSNTKKINYFMISIIFISTISIIYTNYIFSKQTILKINDQIMENEYKKIWWKDNYEILRELQKQEMISYIEKLKQEKPELIEELKQKANQEKLESNYKILAPEFINELKNNTFIKWGTWSLVTIIEFSDLECPYCIDYHKKNISNQILEKYPNKINYIFKNFPLPAHKNAQKESEAALCIKNLSSWTKYLEFINEIFNTTKGWWEWFDLNNLNLTVEKIWINKTDFEKCYNNWTYTKDVEVEFTQWLKLWINSVPSNIIINNKTWEYMLLPEVPEEADFEKVIEEFLGYNK